MSELDTLLISIGEYQELLLTPQIPFTILGEQNPDSGQFVFATIDGTELGGPDSTAVLTVPEHSFPTVKNIRIRNIGRDGIRLWSDSLRLQDCIFDSTDHGVYMRLFDRGAVIQVEHCSFNYNGFACLRILTGNRLIANRCSFSGNESEDGPIVGGGHLRIDSCLFSSQAPRILLLSVNSAIVTNSIFENSVTPPGASTIDLRAGGIVFSNNRIVNDNFNYHALRLVSSIPDSVVVFNNSFENCAGRGVAMGVVGLLYYSLPNDSGAQISNNRFTNCSAPSVSNDIWPPINYAARIQNNYFIHNSVNGIPSIGGSGSPWQPTPVTLRNNHFVNCGYALDGSTPETDARFNYWGDASGPYHEIDNPEGLGDTITGPVQFVPWLEDTSSAISDSRRELPSELSLTAYPNPFNATTRVAFAITRPGHVELILFDILGRNIMPLLSGNLQAGEHEVEVELASLASGVYFAKLTTNDHSIVTKLVLMK
ncbi:MAG: T9SS type A sorting domain-containing protein [bacterium]|nr:T9SS type A sorting domain-containing protein [bacterium]